MIRILVTPRSLTDGRGTALRPLEAAGFDLVYGPAGRQPSEDELLSLVPGCAGWLAGVERINARVFDAADRLAVISRNGTGIDAIDLDAAQRRGVAVLTAAGANAAAVAELTLGLILAGLRDIPASASALKSGRWQRREGRELRGATVGIVGCGAVGRKVARAVTALGAYALGYDVRRDDTFSFDRFSWVDLDRLCAASDVVTLHCPPQPDDAPLLDPRCIALMPAGAGVINTARASLVDDTAMLAALNDGRVGWYATDVFAVEPPQPSELLSHDRVIATPHIGAFTREGGREAVRMAVENLIGALGGRAVREPARAEAR
jgi:D-3-phosphoglycerate dehydrogenase